MRKISKKVSDKISKKRLVCCLCGGPSIQLHHALYYAHKQLDEAYAIVPACPNHHKMVDTDLQTRLFFEYVALRQGYPELIMDYPKNDWGQRLSYIEVTLEETLKKKALRYLKTT